MTERAKVEEDGRRIEAEVDLRLTKYLNAHAKDIEEEVQRRVAVALAKLEEELSRQMEEQLSEETARLKNWEVRPCLVLSRPVLMAKGQDSVYDSVVHQPSPNVSIPRCAFPKPASNPYPDVVHPSLVRPSSACATFLRLC